MPHLPVKHDLHKIDGYLVRLGWLVLAAGLVSTGCTPDRAVALGQGWFTWAALATAVPMLVVGYVIRRKERRVATLWDILDQVAEVPVDELVRNTGLGRPFIREALAIINAQPGAYYVWNPQTDVIVDGRLRTRWMVVDSCASCGAPVNLRLTLELSEPPACAHCGAPVVEDDLNRLKLEALREIRASSRPEKDFSVLLFVVLLVIFWPAALGYALWKSGLVDGWLARTRAV